MRKFLPIIMVLSFWGIFLWGMNNPKVGECVIAITIVGVVLFIIWGAKEFLWEILKKLGRIQQ